MPFATINASTTVDYVVEGEATNRPDLVLVHGTGGSIATNWAHLIPEFAQSRRVIAANFSGSGATTDDGRPLTVTGLVDQVDGAAQHAGASRPYDLVGFSLGAVVAAQLAASHPDRVRRLVLIGPWASSADPRMRMQFDLWRHLHATDRDALALVLTLDGFGSSYLAGRPQGTIDQALAGAKLMLAPGFDRQAALDQIVDIGEALPQILAPTLVFGGTEDHVIPAAYARAVAGAIPGAEYDELECGHGYLYEAPRQLVPRITAFFAG